MATQQHRHKRKIRHNVKPGIVLLILPIAIGIASLGFILSSAYGDYLASTGLARLEANNWQAAEQAISSQQPTYERKFAYYKVQDGQTLAELATFFGVSEATLANLNPGSIVAGTTIKVPPVEKPLDPIGSANGLLSQTRVTEDQNLLRIRQLHKSEQVRTTIPELMGFLKQYNAIEEISPKVFRINRAISLEDNIRLDVTSDTVTRLELRSAPNDITCLCFDGSSALIKGVDVIAIDPSTNQPDTNHEDQRSFVRVKSGRLDLVNSRFAYLGNGLMKYADETQKPILQKEGGTYGISWRIPDDAYGSRITTGWVEGNLFYRNHFGSYSYGASGIAWLNNHYLENDVYGLDPHDDSNNALVENNVFERNGKHGFIVSKRCNYNVIRNNTSINNALHGYMLHQDSAYNVIENNVSYGNGDNFAIYASDFNTIRNNKSYEARLSHIRINEGSRNTYVTGNEFYGGQRGVFVYGNATNVLVSSNTIKDVRQTMATNGAQHVLFANNTISRLQSHIEAGDQVIFGQNFLDRKPVAQPYEASLPAGFTAKNTSF